jgi:hypothetical protein
MNLISNFYNILKQFIQNFFEYISCKTYPDSYEQLRGTVIDNSEDGYFF